MSDPNQAFKPHFLNMKFLTSGSVMRDIPLCGYHPCDLRSLLAFLYRAQYQSTDPISALRMDDMPHATVRLICLYISLFHSHDSCIAHALKTSHTRTSSAHTQCYLYLGASGSHPVFLDVTRCCRYHTHITRGSHKKYARNIHVEPTTRKHQQTEFITMPA